MPGDVQPKNSEGANRPNGVEVAYCLLVVVIFSFTTVLVSVTNRPREPVHQNMLQTLIGCLLALMPIGVIMEIYYRRSKVHGAVIFCIMVTVVMWMLFAAMLFPDRG